MLSNVKLEAKRVVYNNSSNFTLYDFKIDKIWSGNLFFKKAMGTWSVSQEILSGNLKKFFLFFFLS